MDIFKLDEFESERVDEIARDEEEENSLVEQATGRRATFVTKFFELLMKLSSVDLKVYYNKRGFESLLCVEYKTSTPTIMNNSKIGQLLWALLISRPIIIIRVLTICLSTLWLLVGVYLLYKQDKVVRQLELSFPNIYDENLECVRIENLKPYQVQKVKDLENIKRLISIYGVILTNIPGLGLINLGTVATLPLAFFFLTQLLLRTRFIRCDLLSFLFRPVVERRRVNAEIHLIINQLVLSIKNRQFLRFKPKTKSELIASSSLRQKSDDLRFLQLLQQIDIFRWIQPISVSSRWYGNLTNNFQGMLSLSIVAACITPIISSIVLVTLDIIARIGLREKQMKCSDWRKDSFLLRIPYDFREFNEEEQEAYLNHDGSISSYVHLVVYIEAKHYFSFNTWIFLLSYFAMILSIFFWSTFFINTLIFSSMDKVVWISQIDRKLVECLKLIRAKDSDTWGDQEYDHLIKLHTISYLNFELFRRQYRRYLPLGKFFLNQGSMIAFLGLLLFYFIGTSIETKDLTTVIFMCTVMAAVINIYLVAASVVSKKMESITRNVANLLGYSTNKRLIHAYPVELWRRQAISERDICRFYDLHVFGRSLSYKDLISFNLHVFLLVLILVKINNKYSSSSDNSRQE